MQIEGYSATASNPSVEENQNPLLQPGRAAGSPAQHPEPAHRPASMLASLHHAPVIPRDEIARDDAPAARAVTARTKRGNPDAGPAQPDFSDPLSPQPPRRPGMESLPLGPTQVPYRGAEIQLRASIVPPGSSSPRTRLANVGLDALYRPAAESQLITANSLTGRPEPTHLTAGLPALGSNFGATMSVMAEAASSRGRGSNLYQAAVNRQATYDAGGTGRKNMLTVIERFQRDGQWNGDAREIANYMRHPGAVGLQSGDALVQDLERHFSTPYNPSGAPMGHPDTFALVGIAYRAGEHDQPDWRPDDVLAVQRAHTTGDYRNDSYTVFHPGEGAFRYDNFNQLAYALGNFQSSANHAGRPLAATSTSYYAMRNVMQHPMAEQRLGEIGGSYGLAGLPLPPPVPPARPGLPEDLQNVPLHSLTPPVAQLPPPDFDQPGPSGYQTRTRHGELKRDADPAADNQPAALYRPSNVSPEDLKKLGGFSAERTALGQVNLDMHDFDVASSRGVNDSAGYLGTFRKLSTAQQNPALAGAANGYVYAVAPTPNMVDVNGSLGARARLPDNGEVAAMGRIDYTQIRGWQKIENGKPGAFTPNPDYRWDVYDQTRLAGAQPQLAGFAADDPAWGDAVHRPFATAQTPAGGQTAYAPREPTLSEASFYGHALEKIAYLSDRQAQGLDHRAPVRLVSHDGQYGTLQGNIYYPTGPASTRHGEGNTDVTVVNTVRDKTGLHGFSMGDDGRLHTDVLGRDQVLRVGGNGYLYLDYPPKDPNSTNGVFRYENGRLIHQEDGKVVTYSHRGYAYVSSTDYDSDYSRWKLTDGSHRTYTPPVTRYAYHDSRAGSAQAQYAFERDPDTALPAGVTHFATALPVTLPAYPDSASFLRSASPDQQQQIAGWLASNHAALLFKEGFYLVAGGDHRLQVRNLQGDVVDTAGTPSGYAVSDQTWTRLQTEYAHRLQLEALSRSAYHMR